jgi:hypothetical protein
LACEHTWDEQLFLKLETSQEYEAIKKWAQNFTELRRITLELALKIFLHDKVILSKGKKMMWSH